MKIRILVSYKKRRREEGR